jgi:hypothetical protein
MESAYFWIYDFVAALWLPLLFIFAAGYMLYRIKNSPGQASKEAVGIALGVILGFVSQVTITSFDEFRKEQQQKRAALVLLQQDAESVYWNMHLFPDY